MHHTEEARDLLRPITDHVLRHGRPGVASVRKAIKAGEIKAVRKASRTAPYLIRDSEFQRWIESMSTSAA